jgi:hypothetical protein
LSDNLLGGEKKIQMRTAKTIEIFNFSLSLQSSKSLIQKIYSNPNENDFINFEFE